MSSRSSAWIRRSFPLSLETSLADRRNLAFTGTLVSGGEAGGRLYAVTGTGYEPEGEFRLDG